MRINNHFSSHGSLDIRVEGRLLILEGTGPWNLESLNDSGEIAAPLVEPLKGKPWGVVVTILGEPIYVPDAADKLAQVVRQDKLDGRIATAVIVDKCASPHFARTHLSEIYTQAGETFEFFSTLHEAKNWVSKKLAQADLTYLMNVS